MSELRTVARWSTGLLTVVYLLVYGLGFFVFPSGMYSFATGSTVLIGGSLLVARGRSGDHREQSTVAVPRWCVISGILLLVVIGSLATVGRLTLPTFGSSLVFSLSAGYLGSLLIATAAPTQSRRRYRVSMWMLAAVGVVVGLFMVGMLLIPMSPMRLLFTAGLSVMTFYIGFILPVGLVETIQHREDIQPTEPYPDVSIIIPAYNEEGYVGNCIESALATDYPDDHREIIVVDDGSSDGTYEEAAQYRDRGVEVYSRSNGGKNAALNLGFYCASGDIIVPLDADSLLDPTAVKTLAGTLQQDPELGAIAGDVRVGNADSVLTKIQAIEYVFSINSFRRAYSYFGAVPIVPGCIGGFKREALEEIDGYDPDP